jgi:hypothetical protein
MDHSQIIDKKDQHLKFKWLISKNALFFFSVTICLQQFHDIKRITYSKASVMHLHNIVMYLLRAYGMNQKRYKKLKSKNWAFRGSES